MNRVNGARCFQLLLFLTILGVLAILSPTVAQPADTGVDVNTEPHGNLSRRSALSIGTDSPTLASGMSYAKKGDFYLGGLFDVHYDQDGECQKINARGLQWVQAMVYAIELINQRQDLLPNVTLGFHIKDTCGNPNVAVASCLDFITSHSNLGACQNLSADGITNDKLGHIVSVVGPATSNAALSVASLFQLFKLPEISYSATSELLSEARYSYFTRVVPSDSHQATALADIVDYFGWPVVATISTDDLAYGSSGLELFLQRAKNKSICVAYRNKIGSSSTREELLEIVNDLRTFPEVKVIVAFTNESPIIRLLEVFADQNATGYTWIGTDGWTASPTLVADDRIAKVTQGMLGLRYSTSEIDGFVEYLRALSPASSGYQDPFLIEYWETQFKCAVKEPGRYNKTCTGDEMLPESDTFFTGNLVSPIVDSVLVVALALHSALGCGNMQCENITSKTIDGEKILALMKNVSFIGYSGYRIELTEGGDLASGAAYDVFNLKPASLCSSEMVAEKIGVWTHDDLTIHGNITWPSSDTCSEGGIPVSICSAPCRPGKRRISKGHSECCWECVDCLDNHYSDQENAITCSNCSREEVVNANRTGCVTLPDLYLQPGSPFGVTILTISTPGIIITLIFAAIFIHKRHTQIVVRACAGHGYAILFCALCCFISSSLPLFPSSDVYCSVKALLQHLTITLLQGTLVLTAYVSKKGRQFVSKRARVFIVLCVLSPFAVFMSIWFAVDVPKLSRIPDPVQKIIYVDCQDGELLALVMSFSYTLILDAIGLVLAFRKRNQDENFHEGKFMFFSFIVHTMIWVATIGVYFVTGSGKHFQAFILAIGITVTGYVPLSLIYVPKLYFMKTKPYANEKMDQQMQRQIKRKPHIQKNSRRKRPTPEIITGRRALLSSYMKALDVIRGDKAQNIQTIKLCMTRQDELTARYRREIESKRSLLQTFHKRKVYLVVSSPHLPSTNL